MRLRIRSEVCFGLTACLLAAGACQRRERPSGDEAKTAAQAIPSVRADGSSTVFLITEAVAAEFQNANPGIKATVGISGTGGGFKKFCAGQTDVSGASRPINAAEVELCAKNGIEYVELPVAYDGLAVLIHPKNTWATDITTAELKKIWEPEAQGKVTRWNQVRPSWPDRDLHLYGAGTDSGTYDYFTEAIVHKEHTSRSDYTSSEDDNVIVQGIANDELALGFFGYAYYLENKDKLKLVPVDDGNDSNGKGPILPSPETVMAGAYQPLARPIFIYVSNRSLNRPAVVSFVDYYMRKGPRLVTQVGYVPLPESAYALARDRAHKRRTGSMFGGQGSQVGVSIEDLLKKERGTQTN
jgi:phosphate transport system substrate-binding protein